MALVALLAAVYALDGIALPEQTRVWREFTNAGHAPLFGVIAIAILVLAKALFRGKRKPITCYSISFFLSVLLGLLTELGQVIGPRDASLMDFANDVIGAAAFLGIAHTFDPAFAGGGWFSRPWLKLSLRLGLISLFLTAYVPFAIVSLAHMHRRTQFPVVLDFESCLDRQFASCKNAAFDIVQTPTVWPENASARVGTITFLPQETSNFAVEYPFPRWRGYHRLSLEIYSTADCERKINLRIDDFQHNLEDWDRYGTVLKLHPGANVISIPLAEVENAPATRKMDMESIANIILFTSRLEIPFAIYLDNLRLE